MLSEEFGFIGGAGIIFLYFLVIAYGYKVGLTAKTQFTRLIALGMTTSFFCYVFINMAMVMGILPSCWEAITTSFVWWCFPCNHSFISLGFIMNARIHDKVNY